MIRDKKAFTKGVVMAIIFFVVLAYMFSPSFDGGNAFNASDRLFNSIAKGSTYYIPRIREEAEPFKDFAFTATIAMPDKQELVALEVEPGTSLVDAIKLSGLTEMFEGFELDLTRVGIFGHKAKPDQVLREGDRVEIYRPLIADPKEVRRQRALKQAKS